MREPPSDTHPCRAGTSCWQLSDPRSDWKTFGSETRIVAERLELSGESAQAGLESPEIETSDADTLVLRLRVTVPHTLEWEPLDGEARELLALEPGPSFRWVTVRLPERKRGVLRLRSLRQAPARAGAPDTQLTFAEVLSGRGRCYADYVESARRLSEGLVCFTPATAEIELPGGGGREIRASLFRPAGQPPAHVRLSTGGGADARVDTGKADAWTPPYAFTPAGSSPGRIRIRAESEVPGTRIAIRLRAPSQEPKPNVLVYVVDTLRADALGAYGAARATPAFDALAREGTLFEQALAPAPWTLPSSTSLLTGADVRRHGVATGTDVLPSDLATLATSFRQHGYATGAFSANPWFGDRHGLHRGFLEFVRISRPLGDRGAENGRTSALINDALLPWLEQHAGERFLAWVHTMDPHQPYTPPLEAERALDVGWPRGDPRWKLARAPSQGRGRGRLGDVELLQPRAARSILEVSRKLYDATVLGWDAQLARVVETLRRLELLDQTILVVTSDHGEEFGEHGLAGHAHALYQELLRVPLLIRYPPSVPAGARVAVPVGLVDVAPTVRALAGLPSGEASGARDLSRDWGSPAPARPLFAERRTLLTPVAGLPELDAVIEGDLKLIRRLDTRAADELYDLGTDPGETRNLASERPEARRRLGALLERDTPGLEPGAAAPLDEETREQLRSLGYGVD
ncbi:MAG: sulfatase [Deltaproteobacteria bacterium]|nr:sulfatase [Deltaproteobacteria bacterium]